LYYGLRLLFSSWRLLPCARLHCCWAVLTCSWCSCFLTVGFVGHDAPFHM